MIRLLRGTLARLIALGVVSLLLLAVLVTTVRLVLPAADQYRGQITAALSERLGFPVRMGSLAVRLAGWTPRLSLRDVVLVDPQGGADVLSLASLDLDVDLLASLRMGAPQIRAATLVGARLVVHRLADGRIRVQGLGALQSDNPRTLELFLRQGRLNLVDSEIALVDDRLPGGLPRLTEVQLRISNEGRAHRLDLSAHPEPTEPTPADRFSNVQLRVLADMDGDGLDIGTWGGSLYLELRGADALALIPADLPGAGWARADGLTVETWLRLDRGHLEEGLGRLDLDGLRLVVPRREGQTAAKAEEARHAELAPVVDPVEIDRLSALGRIVPTPDGWQIGVRDLALETLGAEAAGVSLDLGLSPEGRLEGVALAADWLDLDLLAPLRGLYPASLPKAAESIVALEPRGRLEQIAFRLEPTGGEQPRWSLQARGDGLSVQRFGEVPGVCGLGLSLRVDQDGGEARLRSHWLRLDLAPLFDQPIYLDRFSGLLSWTRGSDGALRLSGSDLVLENPDLRGRARFSLTLPSADGDPGAFVGSGPFLDLRASLHDGDGTRALVYLPVGKMHPKLTRWLGRALVGGRVPQADLVLRGPLRQFPFREHQGRFEVLVELEDAGLDYLEGWPPIEAAKGILHFLDQGMEVRVDSARILDSVLTGGLARLPDLWSPRRISIHGEAEGPLTDGLRVLGETPLAEHLGPVARSLEVAGSSNLTLDLEVPLSKGESLDLDGHLTLPGPAGLTVKGTPMTVTDLAGELRFTKDTLTAQSTKGQLWGNPIALDVSTRDGGNRGRAFTEVVARSRIPVSDLARRLPSPGWSVVQGKTDWKLALDLRHAELGVAGAPIPWRLSSELRGLTLDLPPPLGKSAGEARPLDLEGALSPGRSLTLRGGVKDLGLDLSLDLAEGGPRLQGGRVTLGTTGPTGADKPEAGALSVTGSLVTLDVPAWGAWWSRFREASSRQVREGKPSPFPGPWPPDLDLRVARLDLGFGTLTDARLRSAPAGGGVALDVTARELEGRVVPPTSDPGDPWQISLARLDVASLLPPPDQDEQPPPMPSVEVPVDLPATDLRVEDLRWGGESLGRLSLDLRSEPSGLGLRHIELRGPGATLVQGEAVWVAGLDGGRTRLSLDLKTEDTGALMRALHYKSVLGEAPTQSQIRLEWPGGLGSFALARSTGTIELEVGAGRLLDVEPGVGRVLGILNLGALSRRLALDFTDLYEQGLSFERILGDIRIGGGQAELRRFEIEGPSSAIRITGFTDLRTHTFDQTVIVEPRIGTGVALASALAGGPIVGAAVYLADKVTGGTIDKLGAYRYRVTGPWAEPELTRLGWDPFSTQAQPGGAAEKSGEPGLESPPPPAGQAEQNHFLD